MSTNGAEKQTTKDKGPLTAEAVFASWTKEGGLELAAERVTEVRALVEEAVAANRARLATERAELQARCAEMDTKFAALGFPGGPPLDDAERGEAKKRGVRLRPIPPADDETLRKALVARILTVQKEHPNKPAATKGLSRWSGATGERIKLVLKSAPEVTNTIEDRWVERTPSPGCVGGVEVRD